MDSQVSTNYEPSVSVAGDGDASVPMEPYQWPATYQPPSMSRLSADIREPGVTVSHLRLMSRPCLLLVVMHPYRWSLKV